MNTPHAQPPGASEPDPSLQAALDARTDGDALRRVWHAVPGPESLTRAQGTPAEAAVTAADDNGRRGEEAWQRLAARIHDPARIPCFDEVPPLVELVVTTPHADTSDEPEAPHVAAATASSSSRSQMPARRPRWGRLTAAALLAVGTGLGWQARPMVHEVPAGQAPARLELADGTVAWLEGGSRLEQGARWRWPRALAPAQRQVTVHGRAFFDVQRDGRPFVVQAGAARVQVLGTRFEVVHTPRERTAGPREASGVYVSVEEGRVLVSYAAPGDSLVLSAGDVARLTGGRLTMGHLPETRVAAWRRGGIAVVDEALGDVLRGLARRYGVAVTMSDEVPDTTLVSLVYPQAPAVDVVLNDLSVAQGLVFERTAQGYVLRARPRE
jgi:ferric-dicitrate binding protein FerR (iron transport regulator)